MEYLNNNGFSQKNATEAAKIASQELAFGTNSRGSNIYRKQLCYVLVKNTLMEVQGYED
jgi:CO/xanthine dehydrogenase FAD-binding subunit